MAVCLFPWVPLFNRAMLRLLMFSGVVVALAPCFPDALAVENADVQQLTGSATNVKSLDVYTDGARIHILTAETHAGTSAANLYHRSSTDDGRTWSAPVRVDEHARPPHLPQRGADAQIAARDGHLVAAWTTKGTGYSDSGPLATAVSSNGGLTWQPGPNPADDGTTTGHSYLDIVADTTGFHMVWLDSRGDDKPLQGLRYASSADDGASWSANLTLDAETCECCWNSLLSSTDGHLYTLYRGLKPRDMLLVSGKEQTWRRSGPVGRFDWSIDACPHSGGGLAMSVEHNAYTLHSAVWTGRDNAQGVYYLSSTDGGETWTIPRRFSDAWSKHPDIAANNDGELVLVWNNATPEDSRPAVLAATSTDGGKNWTPALRLSAPGVTAMHPRIISAGNEFRVFWTERRDQHLLMMKPLIVQTQADRHQGGN